MLSAGHRCRGQPRPVKRPSCCGPKPSSLGLGPWSSLHLPQTPRHLCQDRLRDHVPLCPSASCVVHVQRGAALSAAFCRRPEPRGAPLVSDSLAFIPSSRRDLPVEKALSQTSSLGCGRRSAPARPGGHWRPALPRGPRGAGFVRCGLSDWKQEWRGDSALMVFSSLRGDGT